MKALSRLAASMAAVLALGCATATGSDDGSNGSENDGTGPLDVATATTGTDLDADGYEVTVDGAASQSIGINDQITFSDVAAGDHEVALSGVAGNCTVSGGSQRTITITADEVAQTTFDVTCTQGGGADAGDIYRWNFETVGGPRNDRFGRLSFGGPDDPPLNITAVQNAALAAEGEWFAQSLDLGQLGNNMPAWVYPHTDYEGSHADHLYVRQRIFFTAFAPGESPKTIRFFTPGNDNLGYVLIRGSGQVGPGTVEWHFSDPLPIESGGTFTLNTWHWIEVGLTDISGASPRVRVWLDGELIIDTTGPGASKGAISQTRLLWAGGGAAEDQPFGYPMFVRFDQIDFATFHMGIP